jgi:hypothetical protein
MNLLKFEALMRESSGRLGQQPEEWRVFLEFVHGYFKIRRIETPVVVEIGTMNNVQKAFYQEILGAEHIGIDIAGNADIVGRSQDLVTREKLLTMLHGREIDLLFIDGDHMYQGVRTDCELYVPLTKHIVALHDISHPYSKAIPEETMRLWEEIAAGDKNSLLMTIKRWNSETSGLYGGRQMGIGLILKGGGV